MDDRGYVVQFARESKRRLHFLIAMIEITHCSSNERRSCVPAHSRIMAAILERLFAMCLTPIKCHSTVYMSERFR